MGFIFSILVHCSRPIQQGTSQYPQVIFASQGYFGNTPKTEKGNLAGGSTYFSVCPQS